MLDIYDEEFSTIEDLEIIFKSNIIKSNKYYNKLF